MTWSRSADRVVLRREREKKGHVVISLVQFGIGDLLFFRICFLFLFFSENLFLFIENLTVKLIEGKVQVIRGFDQVDPDPKIILFHLRNSLKCLDRPAPEPERKIPS